jgi:putative transposase
MKAVADALEVARSHLHEKVRRLAKPRGSYRKPDDGDLLPLIRRLVDERPTYGYRRITALANRELVKTGKPMANHKRIFRIMRQNGMLLARHTGRRKGRLHDGKVVVMRSNLRWCSDGFEISCWNGPGTPGLHHRCSRPRDHCLACGRQRRHQRQHGSRHDAGGR